MNFKITSHTRDGEVRVLIDNKPYTYFIDAGYVRYLLVLSRHAPRKALNFLKTHARRYEKND